MRFYTYLWLREDGTPYYVGKGQADRAYRKDCPPRERIIVQEHESEENAFAAEVFLIAFYGRKDLGTGILRNMTDGGQGASAAPQSSQKRILISLKLRNRPLSPAHRKKLSEAKLGKPGHARGKRSLEACRNMSLAHIGEKWSPVRRAKLIGNQNARKNPI